MFIKKKKKSKSNKINKRKIIFEKTPTPTRNQYMFTKEAHIVFEHIKYTLNVNKQINEIHLLTFSHGKKNTMFLAEKLLL